jgi:hypothetical protein
LGKAAAAVVEVEEPCEISSKYTLLIRRAPQNYVVAVLEMLSPTNKGVGNPFDREKYLRKRDGYLQAGINILEVDALLEGQRLFPALLSELGRFDRNAWVAYHADGKRRLRGWGWNEPDALPVIPWMVEQSLEVLVDLPMALEEACEFNRWEDLVRSAES